jgi:hypothetical protein
MIVILAAPPIPFRVFLRLFAANFLLDPRPWTLDRSGIATKKHKIRKKLL